MHRLLKAVLLVMTFALIGTEAFAQTFPIVQVSGRLPQGNYRVFARDTLYQVIGHYTISGTLLIEPGTTVEFLPNSRLIDSVGGRIIADGDVDAIWNNNTSGVSAFPNGYCDVNYMRANVTTSGKPEITAPAPNHINYVPLLLFYHANKRNLCAQDPNLRNRPYARNVVRAPITFRGRPVNQNSREWGHIVVLPGADTAFFRNCNFVNFRKDVTVVQSTQFYAPSTLTGYNSPQITAGFNLNTEMQNLTTGGGGAMTVFSSKTWILDCRFDSNFARYHGGAVQFLQAPFDASGQFYVQEPSAPAPANPNYYPAVNPETFDVYGGPGATDRIVTPFGTIDAFRVTSPSAPATAQFRQAYDDGRMAINQGRVRRVIFRDNRVMVNATTDDVSGFRDNVSNEIIYNNQVPLIAGIHTTSPAGRSYVPLRRNEAFGGAMFVSGRRLITVYLGRGAALQQTGVLPNGDPTDTMIFERNHAVNFQDTTTLFIYDNRNPANPTRIRSEGARGGAIYVGNATSLHFELSRFQANFTATPNVAQDNYIDRGRMSQGGGVYMSASSPEFTAFGNVLFRNNKSAQGGALYLQARPDPSLDPLLSPIIGDSVWFIRNIAEYDGGAVYTQRNMRMQAPFIFSVDSTLPGNPTIDRRIVLDSNSAGLAGGAVVIDNRTNPSLSRAAVENVLISYNTAGDTARVADTRLIKIYDPVAAPMAPGAEFGTATVRDDYNMPASLIPEVIGGGGIYSLSGQTNFYRAVEFLRNYTQYGNGGAIALVLPGQRDNRYFLAHGDSAFDFVSAVGIPFEEGPMPWDQRQMTRFLGNAAWQGGIPAGTHNPAPHGGTLGDPLRNGTGLGGAIYINDRQTGNPNPGVARTDSVMLHRVRIERDTAWSGSAVYSDNYDLRVVFNKSLVANNLAVSTEGARVDTIQNYQVNPAASRTAGATFYGEIEGPQPSDLFSTNGNSIYDNRARFIIRLPDAPSVPGGIGISGVDSLRGNFWGDVQAPVTTILPSGTLQNTFYIQGDSCTLPLRNPAIVNQQGPFESPNWYTYTPVPVGLIPDTLLMEGRVYDIFDKGRDIKSVDYSHPRMAPIEDFSVGIPPRLNRFGTGVYANQVVRRLTRDPFVADIDSAIYGSLQREFVGGHPIGYPLFLESRANYTGDRNRTNDDEWALNHTVMFVINVETGEMIRANLKQFQEGGNVFRGRTEFVADSINRDPVERRSIEGRAAFSIGEIYRLSPKFYLDTPGEIPGFITDAEERLEYARQRAAEYEDSVALEGRRYGGRLSPLEVGGNGFRYINRVNPPSFVDYYAGERYRALPVLTGDRIWVVSRTALWDTTGTITSVVDNARFTGLEFEIANLNSVPGPIVYGQRDSLENKSPIELRNTRFLKEDSNYVSSPTGQRQSGIFEVTATDVNGFFDPRSLYFPDRFTGLRYEYNFLQEFFNRTTVPSNDPSQVRLASWLKQETVYPAVNVSTRDSAHRRGFIRFYGQPHNPDVVPGGELLEIRVSNYPPGIQTIDSLRGLLPDTIVSRYIFLYPPYFNCQVYDARNARYLQQDTVDVGGSTTTTYRMRIFVQDTPPNFLADSTPCATNRPGFAVANLTNRLRFNFDLNTDDEQEDNNAEAERWDFRYGRTTYGFAFMAPSAISDDSTDDVREIRPVWMADSFLHAPDRTRDRGAEFLKRGNIVIRIDSLQAINMLRNPAQANNAFNLDSVFTVVVHDGHMGQSKRDMRVMVNVAPQLQPVAGPHVLPRAKEDFDYNPTLSDTTRRVQATDLNFGQRLRYELVYAEDALNDSKWQTGNTVLDSNGTPLPQTDSIAWVPRDACYFEAGVFRAPKTTPSWLKVNPISGMLYGTPGLNDAPRTDATGNPDLVTVVVTDENGLTDVRTYVLQVDSTQHRPRLFGRPAIVCVDPSEAYDDSISVTDRDLERLRFTEQLTLEVVQPAGFTITPTTITGGAGANDTVRNVRIHANAGTITDTGKVRVVIRVTDIAGNVDSLVYQIAVSEPTLWTVPIMVSNTITETGRTNATQKLVFGMARNATTGEESAALGNLDSTFCEYELPPQPPRDVFDTRWTVPTTNGILRNIFPQTPQAGQGPLAWKGVFQPGFLQGGSFNFPVRICWSVTDANRATAPIHIMDQVGGAVFRVDMKAPTGNGVRITPGSGVTLTLNGDTACVEIIQTAGISGFVITYNITTGVETPTTGEASYMLLSNLPNPFNENTEIGFIAPKTGNVKLEIFNVQGDLVKTLVDGSVDAGTNKVLWNGTDERGNVVASGTYTYRLTAGSTVLTRTMVRVR